MTCKNDDILVIGAGHMRTGTSSLKLALERLFGQKCYHMNEIIMNHPHHIKLWIDIFKGKRLSKEMCDTLFHGYCATVDYPSSLVYKDQMAIYPKAKVILTTRNSDSWVVSVKNTTLDTKIFANPFLRFYVWLNGGGSTLEFRERMFSRVFHQPMDGQVPSDECIKKSFEEFNDEVRKTVPKERLLEFDIKDGWGPLCKFLELPQPNEPFPFVNTTEQFHLRLTNMSRTMALKYGSILILFLAFAIFLLKMFM